MTNKVQLITYVDRLAPSGLAELTALLSGRWQGLFGGVHLLPFFYPIDGTDAGFDPIDHTQVDSRLGGWPEIGALATQVDVMADIIVNHISAQSPQFLDVLFRGSLSPHADLFLAFEHVFPLGATAADLLAIHSTRPSLPFTLFQTKSGERRIFWTSFTSGQIDIDVHSKSGRDYLHLILNRFADYGITTVRLDAAGYAVKKAGTSCFMLPETLAFIHEFTQAAHARRIQVLVEMHGHYQQQLRLARHVDRVYDFALPPLILHALYRQDTAPLRHWLEIAPRNALTVLDTHDGIGVADVDCDAAGRAGLLPPVQVQALIDEIHLRSGGTSREASGAAASNIDELQVNCTFYSALGHDDELYLCARAIQFFAPGIPQVYYVGLLAGRNDMDLLRRTRVGRDINRHYYDAEELNREEQRPVVRALFALIRFRNSHPAFCGEFQVLPSEDQRLSLRWSKGADFAQLDLDLALRRAFLHHSEDGRPCTRSLFTLASA